MMGGGGNGWVCGVTDSGQRRCLVWHGTAEKVREGDGR
jgi:hypothetical protein